MFKWLIIIVLAFTLLLLVIATLGYLLSENEKDTREYLEQLRENEKNTSLYTSKQKEKVKATFQENASTTQNSLKAKQRIITNNLTCADSHQCTIRALSVNDCVVAVNAIGAQLLQKYPLKPADSVTCLNQQRKSSTVCLNNLCQIK
ncbi:hypothetical protein ACOYR1_15965 [Thalassotalea piscium]